MSSPGVSLGTDEVGVWCDDDNDDEGGDHSRLNVKSRNIQSTPDNSNLQGKSKKGSSYREFELSRVRRK